MRRQVQGQVIKWRCFRQLENIPQSSAQWLMKRQSQRKKICCVTREILSQPMATPASSPNVSSQGLPKLWIPARRNIKETSHCCYSKLHIFVLKQSITGADPNKPCIMVILYKLQKSQETGQPLPFLHENYHCSLQCVFLQTFLEPSPTHNIYTDIFFQP